MRKKKQPEICDHCGAKVVEHKHGLSKGLLRGLAKFAREGTGAVNLNDCGMNLSQRTNFYKLKYWGLVVKASDNERGGEWKMTDKGWSFIKGEIALPHYVFSFRGKPVEFAGEDLFVQDVTDGWKYRPEYARDARPHQDPKQKKLV